MVCGCMGRSLVCIGYVSSFTLCWLSLLPGFKGFIGKVVYPPFLPLWGALLVWILLGIYKARDIFPSGGTTPEVQRTLRGGPCVTLRCVTLRCAGAIPRRVRPRGVPFSEASSRAKRGSAERRSEAVPPSEARLRHRAKRGSTEATPSKARPREGHREVAITKKLKKVPPESPGEPLIFDFRYFIILSRNHRVRSTYPRDPGT